MQLRRPRTYTGTKATRLGSGELHAKGVSERLPAFGHPLTPLRNRNPVIASES